MLEEKLYKIKYQNDYLSNIQICMNVSNKKFKKLYKSMKLVPEERLKQERILVNY